MVSTSARWQKIVDFSNNNRRRVYGRFRSFQIDLTLAKRMQHFVHFLRYFARQMLQNHSILLFTVKIICVSNYFFQLHFFLYFKERFSLIGNEYYVFMRDCFYRQIWKLKFNSWDRECDNLHSFHIIESDLLIYFY